LSFDPSTRNRSCDEAGLKALGFGGSQWSLDDSVPVVPLQPKAITGTLTRIGLRNHLSSHIGIV
jgi:hypothetical protein